MTLTRSLINFKPELTLFFYFLNCYVHELEHSFIVHDCDY